MQVRITKVIMDYTKGEWDIDRRHIIDSCGRTLAQLIDGSYEEIEANANLISAAPEMYEAMKTYIDHQEGTRGHYCPICHDVIEQAIAKAEGRS